MSAPAPDKMATQLRIPKDMWCRLRQIATKEDRSINAQALRFIRIGLEFYEKGASTDGR